MASFHLCVGFNLCVSVVELVLIKQSLDKASMASGLVASRLVANGLVACDYWTCS